MVQMAVAIGDDKAAAKYRTQADKVLASFRKLFLRPDGTLTINNQTAHAMALFFGLIPEDRREACADHLARLVRENGNKMTTGFLGTRPLLPALSANGHHDLAGILMRQREFPSWGYEVENGATTIWERWNSYIKGKGVQAPDMNSFSHYAFGAVCEWMFAELAGIDRAAAGFDKVRVAPGPIDGIRRAAASTMTRHGKLACSWRIEGDLFHAEVCVPPNTTAEIVLPVTGEITENGRPVASAPGIIRAAGNRLTAGSGVYQLSGTRWGGGQWPPPAAPLR
jgi:alpha-L-rhamnosidase